MPWPSHVSETDALRAMPLAQATNGLQLLTEPLRQRAQQIEFLGSWAHSERMGKPRRCGCLPPVIFKIVCIRQVGMASRSLFLCRDRRASAESSALRSKHLRGPHAATWKGGGGCKHGRLHSCQLPSSRPRNSKQTVCL